MTHLGGIYARSSPVIASNAVRLVFSVNILALKPRYDARVLRKDAV